VQPGDEARARQYLLERERLVEVVQWHWVRLAKPVSIGVLLLVGLFAIGLQLPLESPLTPVVAAGVIGTSGWLAWTVWEWKVERLLITERRIMLVTGVFTRKVAMMPLKKVTDMTFERPLLGRLLGRWGWGTFILESAGQDQALHEMTPLPEPEELYRTVSQVIFYGAGSLDEDDDDGTGGDPARPPGSARARAAAHHAEGLSETRAQTQADTRADTDPAISAWWARDPERADDDPRPDPDARPRSP
jgi:hypothetical protein